MPSSKLVKNLIGLTISAALIVWLCFSQKWSEVWIQFQQINYWMTLPLLAIIITHFYIRALRWRYLLPKTEKNPSLNQLFDCIMMGNLATYVLPLRAGEFIRPYLLTHFSSHSFSTSFSSVIVERFFDLAVVLLTFAYVVTQVQGLPDWSKHGALLLGVMAIGILIFIIVGSFFPKFALQIVSKFTFFLPVGIKNKIQKFMEDFLLSARVVSNLPNLLKIVLLSALVWTACYSFTLVGLHLLPGDFTILMALTLTSTVALAVAAPSAPGFIGVYQAACIASFQIFGLSSEMAVTYSIVTHILNYLLFGLAAVVFCLRNDFKFRNIFKISR
jgi:uncharacterized protein (TIRG00374 family)